ncbi:MAG: DUF938 domain-containing protein [Deltaproteobacteria bacterium]|nr:DUF938 domain-containing protein [Deltaproteobacteria bacterium]
MNDRDKARRRPPAPHSPETPWRSASDLAAASRAFAPACERNKEPILAVLRTEFAAARTVLEIGSGTGQHAVFFARALGHLVWQTSDRAENHKAILAWVASEGPANVRAPLQLDVAGAWPQSQFDAVFSANTAHIISWPEVCAMIAGVGRVLTPGGAFALYGPFAYDGVHTSDSNAAFDRMLRERDPESGIRDLRDLEIEARRAGLALEADHVMPANNRTLVWRRS